MKTSITICFLFLYPLRYANNTHTHTHTHIYRSLSTSQQSPTLLHSPQTPLTVPTISLDPLLHLVSLPLLRRALEQFPDFTTLVGFIKEPICVLRFYDFLFNAIDDAQGDEEVMAVGSEILSCAV